MCVVYFGVTSFIVVLANKFSFCIDDTVEGNAVKLRHKFFIEFVNFVICLFFMMFGALFRPGYDRILAFVSLTFVISGAIVAHYYGHVGVEVFFVTANYITLSLIVSAIVYFIRKLLFISFNLQV
jgi:hypothetical protein